MAAVQVPPQATLCSSWLHVTASLMSRHKARSRRSRTPGRTLSPCRNISGRSLTWLSCTHVGEEYEWRADRAEVNGRRGI
eukprot:2293112-Rhodomonas_salina.2